MKRIPLRWVLPVFHFAMDAALVATFVIALWHSSPAIARIPHNYFRAVSYDPNVTMMINPRGAPGLQEPFFLLITANLPAGVITVSALSTIGHDVDLPYDSKAFLWAGLY